MIGNLFFSAWRLWLFWLLFFALFRIGFIATQPGMWPGDDPWLPWKSLWYALPLDGSMAGYLMVLPIVIRFLGLLFNPQRFKYFEKSIDLFNFTLIFGIVGVFAANILLYPEWTTLLNYRAFQYLNSPEALFDSVSTLFIVGSIILYGGLVWAFWKLYKILTHAHWYAPKISKWSFFSLPLHLGLLAFIIRGGTGVMAINESAVSYAPHLFCNHAATNTLWHLIHSVLETKTAEHHYQYMPEEDAQKTLKTLFPKPDSTHHTTQEYLTTPVAPNVVLIVMESMTAQVIEHLGGTPGLCPNLERLARNGIRFDSCFSSGFRTDQGIVAVLSGYPAQPDQSILLLTEKSEKLPGLPNILRKKGYSTAFYYGGELTFANMGLWLRSQGFEEIISENDFSKNDVTQRWGADDQTMLQRYCRDLSQLKPPFFATALTLSLHPPFDVPHQSKWLGASNAEKFRHSAHFADYAIGQFMEAAAKTDWYANTIFVFVADHGATLPNEVAGDDPGAKHIPLIITGVPLSDHLHGLRVGNVCNHHDIPATVLGLLGYKDSSTPTLFPWSRDILWKNFQDGGSHDFAYYSNENGLGWLEGKNAGFYDFTDKKWRFLKDSLHNDAQNHAKAYLQMLYTDFLKR